jgi:hypothetical protein
MTAKTGIGRGACGDDDQAKRLQPATCEETPLTTRPLQ